MLALARSLDMLPAMKFSLASSVLFTSLAALGALSLGACGGDSDNNPDGGPGADAPPIDAPPPAGDPLIGIGQVTEVPTPAPAMKFLEGPQWRQTEGDWLFTNIPAQIIYRYIPGGQVTEFLTPSGKANGLAREAGGTLLAAEHGGRRISRITGTTVTPVAERFENKLFNSPNDVIAAADGTIYFTDPPYGLEGRDPELDFNGVFRVAPGGAVTAEYRGAANTRPNGVAISPDGKKVYVAFTHNGEVLGFPVNADGSLGTPTRAAQTVGGADGMAVDISGNLFVTSGTAPSNNGIEVFKPDGTKWGAISVPVKPTNCAFGGADGKTLLITTSSTLYSVTLANPGLPTK